VCVCIHMYKSYGVHDVYMWLNARASTRSATVLCTYMYICICVYMYRVCVCVCVYIYIYI